MTKATTPTATEKPAVAVDRTALESSITAQVVETKIRVHRTVKLSGADSDASSTDDVIDVQSFATVPAMATVSLPIKITRRFQSVGLEVGISIPCYKEELPQALEAAYIMARERIIREIPEIQKALNGIAENGQQSGPTP
jgi:hypothetical protein